MWPKAERDPKSEYMYMYNKDTVSRLEIEIDLFSTQ